MNLPTTPTKKGDQVNKILQSLNARWGLRLPVKNAPYSPSKTVNPEGKGERIYQKIRFLYFKNEDALKWARTQFEDRAQHQQPSNWVFKPLGDTDTLPASRPSDFLRSRDPYTRLNVSEATLDSLEETLLHFLDKAIETMSSPTRARSIFRSGNARGTGEVHFSREPSALDQSPSGSRKLLNVGLRSPGSTLPSSSYIYAPDQDTTEIMRDLMMAQTWVPSSSAQELGIRPSLPAPFEPVACGDVFTKPSSTPPRGGLSHDTELQVNKTGPNADLETAEQYFLQQTDKVQLPEVLTSGGLKRPLPDAPTISVPRKSTWETRACRTKQVYGVNHLEPSVSNGAFDPRRSFDSASQMTASTVTTASTTLTTPNTSFYTESATTSFGASTNDDASSQLMQEHEAYNRQKLAEMHLESENDAMDVDDEDHRKPEKYSMERRDGPMSNPSGRVGGLNTTEYLKKHLHSESQFGLDAISFASLPFRQLYETSRVALHCKLPFSTLSSEVDRRTDDYEHLWSVLKSQSHDGNVLPERSPAQAWDRAEEDSSRVVFSGDLKFNERVGGPVFQFQLKPLKVDRSSRISRKFGGDRLFVLGIPSFDARDLPPYLRSDAVTIRVEILSWLIGTNHQFLGRTWRVFFVKPQQTSTMVRKKSLANFNEIRHRIYLFAVDGYGFRRGSGLAIPHGELRNRRIALTVNELLEWFMPFRLNAHQPCLKLFSRLKQAVSDTIETVSFRPAEVIRTYDAFSDSPGVRRLSSDCRDQAGRDSGPPSTQAVMNDGCARISRAAAAAISVMLGLRGLTPAVFQGRIAGAKGIWMVDALSESLPHSERDYWIEITDSQLKFEGHAIDAYNPDPARLTFEVNAIPAPLLATKMNFQLMPILIDRGVPGTVFERLLEEDLTIKVSELENAMDSGLALRKWTQDNYPVASERSKSGSVEMLGGLPSSNEETIDWFVEHGFEPKSCRILKDLCFKAIRGYCDRLEARMNIGIGRSTTAFMIADPLAVLEEGEVHIGFSGAFRDERSEFHDTMLNDIDILVARSPALLPSDIQKVRAVFKPSLAIYKDVIVFPSKGQRALADKLSGGDYDGDRAWICWEPDIVNPFANWEPPAQRGPDYYGLKKDTTKIADIINFSDYIIKFLSQAFDFNMQPQMLGICTIYHEALCYKKLPVSSPLACDIALLLGHLVDSSKGGLIFTDEHWSTFKKHHNLPKQLFKPAYKDKSRARPTNHIIDRLVFQVAKGVSERALGAFSRRFADAVDWDDDLNAVCKAEDEASKRDPDLKAILLDLCAQCETLHDFWIANCNHPDPDEAGPSSHRRKSDSGSSTFHALVEQTRDRFLAIQPLSTATHPMKGRWISDTGCTRGAWLRLKASTLWNRYYKAGKFVWFVCGTELGELKALGRGKAKVLVEELYCSFKVDANAVRKLRAGEERKEVEVGEEAREDEFGNWDDWANGIFDG